MVVVSKNNDADELEGEVRLCVINDAGPSFNQKRKLLQPCHSLVCP